MLWTVLVWGCAAHRVADPPGSDWTWAVDREGLPGGSLHVLTVATVRMRGHHVVQGGDRRQVERGPISVLLFDHPEHGPVLIDTGYGRRSAVDLRDYPGGLESRILGLEMLRPAADALADLGYDAEDVEHVVLTHAHMDHAGGLEDFPGARVHVDADEWRACRLWRPGRGYLPRPYRKRAVETIAWTEAPYGPFDRHLDFFGDGSLVLLPAPGHTAGSLMALVNLPSGSVLYTGDAAWVDENWERPVPKGWFARAILERDWRRGMEAQWRIRALKDRAPELVVIAGHEPDNLARLPAWPDPLVPTEVSLLDP